VTYLQSTADKLLTSTTGVYRIVPKDKLFRVLVPLHIYWDGRIIAQAEGEVVNYNTFGQYFITSYLARKWWEGKEIIL